MTEECKQRTGLAPLPRAEAFCEGKEPEGPRTMRYASLEVEELEVLWAELGPRRLSPSPARDVGVPMRCAFPAEVPGASAACEPEEERRTLPVPSGESQGIDEALSTLEALSGATAGAALALDLSELDPSGEG